MSITHEPGERRPKLAFDFTGRFGADVHHPDDLPEAVMALTRAMGYEPVDTPPTPPPTPPCVAPVGSIVEVASDSIRTGANVPLEGIQCVVSRVGFLGNENCFALDYPGVLKGQYCVGTVYAKPSQFRVVRRAEEK